MRVVANGLRTVVAVLILTTYRPQVPFVEVGWKIY
jgi:hypothetical protein